MAETIPLYYINLFYCNKHHFFLFSSIFRLFLLFVPLVTFVSFHSFLQQFNSIGIYLTQV